MPNDTIVHRSPHLKVGLVLALVVSWSSNRSLAQPCSEVILAVCRATGTGYLRTVGASSWGVCQEATLTSVPGGVAFGPNGGMYVWIQNDGPLLEYNARTGQFVRTVVAKGAGGPIQGRGIAFMPNGDVLVAGGSSDRVVRFNPSTGAFVGDFVTAGSGGIQTPFGLAFGPNGNLFVGSFDSGQVFEYDGTSGAFVRVFVSAGAGGLQHPYDLTFGSDGHLYVTDRDVGHVLWFDGSTGASLGTFTSAPLPPARGIAFGPNGNLFVCTWQSPAGVYEYDGSTGALLGLRVSAAAALGLAFQCTASITQHPQSIDNVCSSATALFSVSASGAGPFAYQWQYRGGAATNWTDLVPGENYINDHFLLNAVGVQNTLLAVDREPDGWIAPIAGQFRCKIVNQCLSLTSNAATLTICAADFNCDGFVNGDDYDFFATAFDAADPAADFNCDGFVNGDDYDMFASSFESNC